MALAALFLPGCLPDVAHALAGIEGTFEYAFDAPRHLTSSGAPRLDWRLNSGQNCGAPAAHAYCEMMQGPGFVATDFAKDADIGSSTSPT